MKKKYIVWISCVVAIIIFVSTIIIISIPNKKSPNITETTTVTTTVQSENHTHIWSEWITDKESTCDSNGLKYRICECGEIDEIKFAPLEHSFSEWITITNPLCNINGLEERTCSECNYKESKVIDALVHTEGDWIIADNEKHFLCIHCKISLRTELLALSEGLLIENGTVLSIGDCQDLEIVIPSTLLGNTITIIGEQAFKYEQITNVILPDTTILIQEKAFYQCSNLEFVHFGSSINTIGKRAFFKCIAIKNIRFPESLTTIEEYAFAYCASLENIYIENSLKKIEDNAFQDCKQLINIFFNGTIEEWNAIEKDERWDFGTSEYTVHCINGNITK